VPQREAEQLRIVIANEPDDRLDLVATIVRGLGHEVTAREVDVAAAGAFVVEEHPDVAIVGLGRGRVETLLVIERIVRQATCPVIVDSHGSAAEFAKEAARQGVFAQVGHAGDDDWRAAIEIALHRFAQYRDLEKAFARRAMTERAKGILMERHSVDEQRAFVLLRDQARRTNRKLVDVAAAVLDGHPLLPAGPQATQAADVGVALALQNRITATAADPPSARSRA
jgi:AmiR/NasT family two-component response regulator